MPGEARPLDLDRALRVGRTDHLPMLVVTDAEWCDLVEKFGLADLVVDEYASGALDSEAKFMKVFGIAFAALITVATAVFFAWYLWAIATGNIHHHHH